MADTSFKIKKSLNIEPKSSPTLNAEGDIGMNSTSHKLELRDNAATRSVVTEDGTATLTNKTFDADGTGNSITNIENADIKAAAAIALDKLAATTASRALVSDASGFVSAATTTATEIGYVNGVTSAIQTQLNTKITASSSDTLTNKSIDADANTITNIENADIKAAAAIALNKLAATTASRALVSDGSGFVSAATTTATEIGYVNGVTSAIQTQLDSKVAKSTLTTKGDIYVATGSATVVRQSVGTDGHVLTADSAQTNGLKWSAPALAPTGTVMMYAGSSAPTGYLLCDGSAVSRTTYADLFAVCSTTYGSGDGSTTFNVPDARGVFVRGAGTQTISTIDYTGTRGTTQGDQFQGHYHDLSPATTPASYNENGGAAGPNIARISTAQTVLAPTTDGSNGTPRTGSETRPANIVLTYIIKT